jgi:nucleoside transporter
VILVLHLIGAVFLFAVTRVTSFGAVYALMLAYCICYFPTISLTTSLSLRHLPDARRFPLVRVFGTIGWIAIGLTIGRLRMDASPTPFLFASAVSLVMSAFCLLLPHTPPESKGRPVTAREILGLDALVLLKERSFLVFIVASILACIPLTFYFSFTNTFLNEAGVANAAGKMTLGQLSEVGVMVLMPWIFRRAGVKAILLLGLATWSIRYAALAYGNAGDRVWMFYLAILVHGVCYDFFFMTGQLYTDQKAPSHLRSTAQGFYMFVTYGVGMLVGSLLSGGALDYFTNGTRNWTGFWMSSSLAAFALFLVFALFLRGGGMIRNREPDPQSEKMLIDRE